MNVSGGTKLTFALGHTLDPGSAESELSAARDDNDLPEELTFELTYEATDGKDFSESGMFTINKGIKPSALGIALASPGLGADVIRVGDW